MFRILGFRALVTELVNRFTTSVRALEFMYLFRVLGLGYGTWGPVFTG